MSLERNLIKFLLINLVLGLTQEKVLKILDLPLVVQVPGPQSGASFSSFSTVSVSSPVASSLDGAVGPHAAAVSGAAVFHEECRQDPEFRNRVLGVERMLRFKAALSGTETVPVSKVSGAVPGVSVLDDGMDGACSAPRASPGAEDTFVNNVHDFDDCLKDADSALGVRDQPARAVAGESSGIIGLHEVSESDSSLHISRVTNQFIEFIFGCRHVRLMLLPCMLLPHLVHGPQLHACLMLLLHMRVLHTCIVHVIQAVLVASCLCRGLPVTA